MGREFFGTCEPLRAFWSEEGHVSFNEYAFGVPACDIPAFIEWLQAGPPVDPADFEEVLE